MTASSSPGNQLTSRPRSLVEGTGPQQLTKIAAAILLTIHALLLTGCAIRYSFTWTEIGLLPAGIIDWRHGDLEVFRVNPPLVRMLATLPLIAAGVDTPYHGAVGDPRIRVEREVAREMVATHGTRSLIYLVIARLTCLPVLLTGAWVAFRWTRELFGDAAGLGCLALWSFSPMLLGFGCLISGDAQAASFGVIGMYAFRNWLRAPGIWNATAFGAIWGLAILTKFSWLIGIIVLPLMWFILRITSLGNPSGHYAHPAAPLPISAKTQGKHTFRTWISECCGLLLALGTCIVTINTAYSFQGAFRRLGDYEFISQALGSEREKQWASELYSGNRFKGSWLEKMPVPLPENMMIGIDLQKWDFDRPRQSYFCGQWREQGWHHYYLVGLVLKFPAGGLVLLVLAGIAIFTTPACRAHWQEELILCGMAIAVLLMVSWETGLNRHLRYALPAVPFMLMSTSRVFKFCERPGSRLGKLVTASTIWYITSSLFVYPHSISYFNELAGGPRNGIAYFNSSNFDWGQDWGYASKWFEERPDARPIFATSQIWVADLAKLGLPRLMLVPTESDATEQSAIRPGWYAIDRESLLERPRSYRYLLRLSPVAEIGYGIVIFQIDENTAANLQ